MIYEVYFEIYGKKMKTTVSCNSIKEAKNHVKNKISFIKIKPKDEIDFLKKMFNF